MSRIVAPLVVLLGLLAPTPASAPAAGPPPLRPLHAETGPAPRVADDAGRTVLLRGVNVNQLGDYYQANPRHRTVVPLEEADFREISGLGMGVVRLLVHWSALEPTPGAFDEAYVARIRQAVGWAREHGLYVVLDMHQDAWGKTIATPPGESCLPGFSPAVGWDGAPAWATLTDGLPTCRVGLRELSPAVGRAWQSFWDDRDGIQGRLVATWGRLAARFADDPTIAGYDLLNEPNPGLTVGLTEAATLGVFYARALRAIRAAERGVAGGFAHIAFIEPGVEWSAAAFTVTPPAALLGDENIVFAPHIYAESISPAPIAQGFDAAAAAAASYRSTVWSGEWGFFGDPAQDARKIAAYAAQEDSRAWGGAWWDWRQACGDPHVIPVPGGEPGAISPSLHRYRCPGDIDLGIPPTTRRVLERAYVRHAPGALTLLRSAPASAAFRAEGRVADDASGAACALDAWAPARADGLVPGFSASGVSGLTVRPFAGGWRVGGCARGAWTLTSAPPTLPTPAQGGACLSRRVVLVTPRRPAGSTLLRIRVRVPGARVRVLRGAAARRVRIDLRGRPAGRYRIVLEVTFRRRAERGAQTLRDVRVARACARR